MEKKIDLLFKGAASKCLKGRVTLAARIEFSGSEKRY